MDLESVFQTHAVWIEEFCTAIFKQDALDATTYEKDNYCALGQWLHSEGKTKYGKLNAYTDLISSHAEFHKAAGRVAQAIHEKNFGQAENLLSEAGEYAVASNAVRLAISKFKEEAQLF